MKPFTLKIFLGAALGAAVGGFAAVYFLPYFQKTQPLETITSVPFMTLAKGNYSDMFERQNLIIRSEKEWEGIKRYAGNASGPLQVDFDKDMVVAVFLGSRSTAGYSVKISRIVQTNDRWEIYVKEEKPPADAALAQVLTQPYHIVVTARSDRGIRFI